MAEFSLSLNEDQLQIQKWIHDFAEGVMRPAAEEWDEREETPWPIIQEAAQIGLYSWEFVANAFADPLGLTFALWTAANLVPRARANHLWYKRQFGDYPIERHALIPGVW